MPLARWDVGERLEREFLLSLGNPAQVVLWLKRSARYFPYIERELTRAGLPEDLKYVAVIESALLPGAYSHASALGIWQFIASTAKRYGLAVTTGWDERRNPERSTAAALAYLRELRQRFPDWPLALAAYNAGEGRVEQALRHQGVASYYQVALADETERYVFRALAAKLILSEPERYGFEVPHEQRYRAYDADVVAIELRDRMAVAELARQAGLVLPGAEDPQPGDRRGLARQGPLRDPRAEGTRPRASRGARRRRPARSMSRLPARCSAAVRQRPSAGQPWTVAAPTRAEIRSRPPAQRAGRPGAAAGRGGSRGTRRARRDRPPCRRPRAGATTS